MSETLAIAGDALSAEVALRGAELVRLRDGAGRDLLWDGDPAFWAGRAPLLFPIVGRLRDDRYRMAGRAYPLPQHGFARHSAFEPVASGADRCTLRLRASEATRAVYPFPFRLDVTYAAAGAALTVEALVTNEGPEPMPAAFGFHTAFRWPLPGSRREEHAILFERPEDAPIHRPADGLLSRATDPSPVRDRRLPLDDALFEGGALIFTRPESRSVTYGAPGGIQIRVDFPGMPHLGLWTKPGAGFVCLEPWQGYADPQDFAGVLAEKPGLVVLGPGEGRTFAMTIAFVADAAS